jgi:Bacterial protein of unknown function (YtfJ_HI0045)
VGSSGGEVRLSSFRGKPLVVFYEDAASVKLNKSLKDELWNRKAQPLADVAGVVGIANLKSYNFFPLRNFALHHMRGLEQRVGIPILADLEGHLGEQPWGLPAHNSTVLLLDKNGEVVFVKTGALSTEEVHYILDHLESLSHA